MSPTDRTGLIHILGITGTGKTTLAGNLYVQDAAHGLGAILIEPKGGFSRSMLWRIFRETDRGNDVVWLDAGDLAYTPCLPLCSYANPHDLLAYNRQVNQWTHVFRANWGEEGAEFFAWGAQLEQLIRCMGHLIVANADATLSTARKLLHDADLRGRFLRSVVNEDVIDFWVYQYRHLRPERVDAFRNKLGAFLENDLVKPIVTAAPKIDWDTLIRDRKLVIVTLPLDRLGEEGVSLLGSIVIGEILTAGINRLQLPERERYPVTLYIDEVGLMQTPDLHQLAFYIREAGISLVQMNQDLSQFTERNRAAALGAPTFIAGRLGAGDLSSVVKKYDNTPIRKPPKYEPIYVPVEDWHGNPIPNEFEQLQDHWGGRYDDAPHGVVRLVPGDELPTSEMRDRLETEFAAKLPFHEFIGMLPNGNELSQSHFHSIASPVAGQEMPSHIQMKLDQVRDRSRAQYCTPRIVAAQPSPLWDTSTEELQKDAVTPQPEPARRQPKIIAPPEPPTT